MVTIRTRYDCTSGAGRAPPGLAAIRDIPSLLTEIERLWTLLTEERIRQSNLRAAALATMSAFDAHETDPLSHLRAELSGNIRRGLRPRATAFIKSKLPTRPQAPSQAPVASQAPSLPGCDAPVSTT